MRRILLLLLLLSGWLSASAQDACTYTFKGNEKSNFEKGVKEYEAGHYAAATVLLRKVSSKHPKAAEPYFYLGIMAAEENRNPAAIRRYFSKLEELCPEHPDARVAFYQGIIDYTDEKYEQAVIHFNRYFEITNATNNPDYVKLYEEASNYLYWSEFLSEAMLNPVPFNPVLVVGVSSKSDEFLPYQTWDGQYYYYLRQISTTKQKTYYGKMFETYEPRLCMSKRKGNGFTAGEQLPSPFNQGIVEGGVTLTADNSLLYYSIQTKDNFDIYFSECKGGVWQPTQSAGLNVNKAKSWDSQPSISPDGQFLYFASNREGGYGGTDIWYCRRLPNGDWSRAENLGPRVNTAGNEKCPFIHADGKTLYFASNGWQGFGGYDMYFINLNDNYVKLPTNMGMPINGDGDDICFGITADGKSGYYADKAKENNGVGGYDVFSFELYPDARPEGMKIVKLDEIQDKIVVRRKGFDDAVYLNTNTYMVPVKGKCVVARYKDDMIYIDTKLTTGTGKMTEEGRMAIDLYVDFLLDHPTYTAFIHGPEEILNYMVNDRKMNRSRLTQAGSASYSDAPARITINAVKKRE